MRRQLMRLQQGGARLAALGHLPDDGAASDLEQLLGQGQALTAELQQCGSVHA